ncbi:MAG: DUF493 domain-containing protein [Bacteroidetes bacterium]|nr:DUF493 domain-containing protein [Bacteroidota bacterium]
MQKEYQGLHGKLNEDVEWPRLYLFKFIIPNDNKKLAIVESLFGAEAQVTINTSRTGKYLSISGKEIMMSAIEIIARYEKAAEIDGLISL